MRSLPIIVTGNGRFLLKKRWNGVSLASQVKNVEKTFAYENGRFSQRNGVSRCPCVEKTGRKTGLNFFYKREHFFHIRDIAYFISETLRGLPNLAFVNVTAEHLHPDVGAHEPSTFCIKPSTFCIEPCTIKKDGSFLESTHTQCTQCKVLIAICSTKYLIVIC